MPVEIEKDVPIPLPKRRGSVDSSASVLRRLEIGDSVFFSWENDDRVKLDRRINARISYAKPFKFTRRLWPIDAPTGYRVWRIK